MNARLILGWLLIAVASLLAYSQTVALRHFMGFEVDNFDFPSRYAIESSIENYGLALVVLVVGIFLLRSSAHAVAWAAFAVVLVALWLMVGRELWLHYYELPRKYPHFADAHPPYFTGTLWTATPRFLWHLILPVTAVLSALHAFGGGRKSDREVHLEHRESE
jgi:hypothetical protein